MGFGGIYYKVFWEMGMFLIYLVVEYIIDMIL